MADKKKKCFVITPIGDSNTDIRRHIDGIIDQAIVPAIGDKYIVDVAHRKYEIGSINDRVIKSIYESDLVIANLTTLNPNVMFELAIRYSFGKPAIVIAEKGTKLPFDIVDENTVFYINDPAGADELKNSIIEFEQGIDTDKQEYGPIYQTIRKIPIYKEVESGEKVSSETMMSYIIDRLDSLEKIIENTKKGVNLTKKTISVQFLDSRDEVILSQEFKDDFLKMLSAYDGLIHKVYFNTSNINLYMSGENVEKHIPDLVSDIKKTLDLWVGEKTYRIVRVG